jgi:hypothetical protein
VLWCPEWHRIFALLKPVAQESCLITGLVEWPQVLDGEESLADWVHFEAQKKRHAVKAEETKMLRHGLFSLPLRVLSD